MKLDMITFLSAYERGPGGEAMLLLQGFPFKVINERAERYASRGYYDYGVAASLGWLTPKGISKLAELRAAPVSKESTE